jgi:predicted GTPase
MANILNDNVVKQITEYLQNRCIDKEKIKRELNKWRDQIVNIGVIGERGAGKSTIVNALRDLYASDEGAATIDCVDCTRSPTPYPYSNGTDNRESANIVLWDLPGAGTLNYPIHSYLDRIKVLETETIDNMRQM